MRINRMTVSGELGFDYKFEAPRYSEWVKRD